ncbi:MAG: glycoside hydrolase family 31 protein [bacterium]
MKPFVCVLLAALLMSCSDDKTASGNDAGQIDAGADVAVDQSVADSGMTDVGTDASIACDHTETPVTPPAIRTPRWAFEPWISKDISDAADTYAFVQGFEERDIPVGVVVLDSPWETHYNTFIPSPTRYPNFEQMVSDLRQRDVRVVLWVTQMVNTIGFDVEIGGDTYVGPASNYQEGLDCGYYVDNGKLFNWWKGRGSGVDFFNPGARAWWHAQQNTLLDLGVAGWKLDFGESYIRTDTVETAEGTKPHQAYSEAYYQDFWEHGAARLGTEEFLTMVRGYDASYDFEGRFFARREHAPVVWAGDNRRDWVGLEDALDHMFRSAAAGYVVVGSDLGGYLDRDDVDLSILVPANRANFLRWTAASALSPFMQLHGRANLTPWTFPNDTDTDATVDAYRYWATLHHELVPFHFALAEEGFKTFTSVLRPVGDEASWPGDWRYTLGSQLLVAPILNDEAQRDVELPAGTWFDPWTGEAVSGTQSVDLGGDYKRAAVWAAQGAIIPMEISSAVTGIGDTDLAGSLTLLVFPGDGTFVLHENGPATASIQMNQGRATIAIPDVGKPVWLRMLAPAATLVQVDGQARTVAATRAQAGLTGYVQDGNFVWLQVDGAAEVVVE